jgi:hypothetical protein
MGSVSDREAFEAWATEQGYTLTKWEDGRYRWDDTRAGWAAWQAATRATAEACASAMQDAAETMRKRAIGETGDEWDALQCVAGHYKAAAELCRKVGEA